VTLRERRAERIALVSATGGATAAPTRLGRPSRNRTLAGAFSFSRAEQLTYPRTTVDT